MRALAVVVVMLAMGGLSVAAAPVASTSPPVAVDEATAGGPRAQVSFVRTVSGPTPFTDSCGFAAAEPFVDAEVEPHLSVNPTNPKHLLATWQQDRYAGGGARSNLVAVSHNGGKSWRSSTLPGISSCTGGERLRASDPWTAIGADGTAYVSSFVVDAPANATDAGITDEFDGDTVINRSRSGGATWDTSTPVAEDDGTFFHEKAAIVADPYAAETLYAVWARHLMPDPTPVAATLDVAAVFARSDDGGRTWSDPVALPPDLPEVNEWPDGRILVLPPEDGQGPSRLVVVARANGTRRTPEPPCLLYSTTSGDGGETWTDPVVFATPSNVPLTGDYERVTPIRHGTPCLVTAASGPDGTAYAAWFDRTLEGDGPGGAEIRFARSAVGGTSWVTGVAATVPHQVFNPTIAVAGDGTVGITYFDMVNDALGDDEEELTTDLRFASSEDEGETWEQIDVAGPFDLRTAPNAEGYMLGDYFGLVGLSDGFGALVAFPAPIAERGLTDIFYARITFAGSSR